jgi:ADP-ribose pyrophosphatase
MSVVFRGKWFTVVHESITLGDGRTIIAEWISRTDGVRVLATRDDGAILINDEYRSEIDARDLRLPGGRIDDDQTAVAAAARELREETGFLASEWTSLGATQPFSTVRYKLHYFEARGLRYDPIDHDEGEDIRVEWVPLAEAAAMALDGRIGEAPSALQVLRMAWSKGVLPAPP